MDAVRGALEVAAAFLALVVSIVASPILLSKARLLRERNEAMANAERLQRVVIAMSDGVTGLSALTDRFDELAAEVRALRHEQADLRRTLVVAVRHVADLMTHIRSRRPVSEMPPLPAEIGDKVLAEIHDRERHHDAAVMGVEGLLPTSDV